MSADKTKPRDGENSLRKELSGAAEPDIFQHFFECRCLTEVLDIKLVAHISVVAVVTVLPNIAGGRIVQLEKRALIFIQGRKDRRKKAYNTSVPLAGQSIRLQKSVPPSPRNVGFPLNVRRIRPCIVEVPRGCAMKKRTRVERRAMVHEVPAG